MPYLRDMPPLGSTPEPTPEPEPQEIPELPLDIVGRILKLVEEQQDPWRTWRIQEIRKIREYAESPWKH